MGFRWRTISCKQTNVSSFVYRLTCHVSHNITRDKVKMLRQTIVLIVPSDRLDFDRSLRSIQQDMGQRFRHGTLNDRASKLPGTMFQNSFETDRAREHVERFLPLSWRELVRRITRVRVYVREALSNHSVGDRYRAIRAGLMDASVCRVDNDSHEKPSSENLSSRVPPWLPDIERLSRTVKDRRCSFDPIALYREQKIRPRLGSNKY